MLVAMFSPFHLILKSIFNIDFPNTNHPIITEDLWSRKGWAPSPIPAGEFAPWNLWTNEGMGQRAGGELRWSLFRPFQDCSFDIKGFSCFSKCSTSQQDKTSHQKPIWQLNNVYHCRSLRLRILAPLGAPPRHWSAMKAPFHCLSWCCAINVRVMGSHCYRIGGVMP